MAIDVFWIEPHRLEITYHAIQAPIAHPLRIVHLTDLHIHRWTRWNETVLTAVAAQKPDLIGVTGDTFDRAGVAEPGQRFLRGLHAPLGVWCVRGNWENRSGVGENRAVYKAAGAHYLENENVPIAQVFSSLDWKG